MRKAAAVLLAVLLALTVLSVGACQYVTSAGSGGLSPRDGNEKGRQEVYGPSHPSFVEGVEFNSIVSSVDAGSEGKTFLESEYKSEPESESESEAGKVGKLISGVVPHHLVAGKLIARFLAAVAAEEPEVVIVVGPNHENLGGKIITGKNHWQTPAGIVRTNQEITQKLLDNGIAVRDEEILSVEHSIGALVPFIGHYMPQAQVVPVILHHNVSMDEADKLLDVLMPYCEGKTVLLASVDFSHYLKLREANEKDRLTRKYMEDFDYKSFFRLGNDHLDSPASLALAFRLAERLGSVGPRIVEHSNSALILGNDTIETTSYFTLYFSR